MQEIVLRQNQLKGLHVDVFASLRNLEILLKELQDLSENKIETLPERLFSHNEKLMNIRLQNKKIKKIDSDFDNMPQLVILDFTGNVCMNEDLRN